MKQTLLSLTIFAVLLSGCETPTSSFRIKMKVADNKAQDGRLLLVLSKNAKPAPIHTTSHSLNAPMLFGLDVDGMTNDKPVQMNDNAYGFPVRYLHDVPPGEYYAQVVLNRYETFKLKNGKTVKLPPDMGEGQHWNVKPGNFVSKVVKITIGKVQQLPELLLDSIIKPITPPADTKYVKHIRIQSKLLSEFWGRPMFLGANVLLPEGFDEHPQARYPLMIYHGHFPADFGGFSTTPADPKMDTTDYNERFRITGYNKFQAEEAYKFYQQWISKGFPRFLVMEIQHANPYYDDSYAVNSENLGPYGDAIMHELLPEVEKQFRGIGESWSRFTYGGSTGGWEALAVQMFYPDMLNGCFAACPDPVDFRAYGQVNIYEDSNAYYYKSDFKKVARPAYRDYLGRVYTTVEEWNHYELALGDKTRSGEQWDIWEAVFSPQGEDGYPKRIFNKETGDIDHEVAAYWREHYDLRYILQRDWKTLGPKLEGKIHIYCGDMDNIYLNNAVYLMENFLKTTSNPFYNGEVDYGDRAEHCWNGDHTVPIWVSRLHYNTQYLPKILERIRTSAPRGADLTSWRY